MKNLLLTVILLCFCLPFVKGPLFRPLRRVAYEEDENRKQLREGVLG